MDWGCGGWPAFGGLALLNLVYVAIWKPYLDSYMGEKGKRLATKEDINQVLTEVRLVTSETETIKATISGGLWHRQMILGQKRDLYTQVLDVLSRLQDRHTEIVA